VSYKSPRCQWQHGDYGDDMSLGLGDLSGVIDSTEMISPLSMTPRRSSHWHSRDDAWLGLEIYYDLVVVISEMSMTRRRWSLRCHLHHGNLLSLGGFDWWKKTKGQKSRATVPLWENFYMLYLKWIMEKLISRRLINVVMLTRIRWLKILFSRDIAK
jgi:hypothetical protein